ncbi:MAG TPA: hypothetical protein VLF18_21600 [Tahibacter sp.]|uniref:hypothetical protein n=1 Tax=Tahibacter sp. TaxID=2056211 RepID=UPI002C595EF4|nr:hypothetical protein [Tahibacter sp.]HSX62787.1 hypothetical protein [Tahibacter sp.]
MAAALPGKTELRIEVRHGDGTQAILSRSLDEREERRFGIDAGSDTRPEALGAPLPPQPPTTADYPPGASQLEFVQRRGVWVRTSTFTRGDDGNWQLVADTLDNPRDRNTLSKPLVGTIRPVE